MTVRVLDEQVVDPTRARFYAEGWQSWSPTRWWRWGEQSRPAGKWEQTMRFRPGRPPAADALQAEGLLVVEPGTGEPSTSYAVDDAAADVASIRAVLEGDRLTVTADGPVTTRRHPDGPVAALTAAGDAFAAGADVGPPLVPPRVWCSWYRYLEEVTARDVEENLAALEEHALPVDVIQIDDGWSAGLGEGLRPAPAFGDLARLVDRIRATGRRAGIWLAPFLVGADTVLARTRPEWLTGDAGHNWGQRLRGLDLTHPAVRDLLHATVSELASLGVGYFKLDFLYAGALPARRYDDVPEVEAYRSGLALLREAAGPGSYLLGCGAPILPSLGLVDAMRVSPDTFHEGGEDGSTGLRGQPALVARSWQQGRFWVNDPDCLVARPGYALRERWAETVARYGGLRSCSDRIADLDSWGLQTTRRLLESPVPPRPFSDEVLASALTDAPEPR